MAAFHLNPAQLSTAIKWLDSKTSKNLTCPVCHEKKFTIEENLVEIKPFHGGNIIAGGTIYPHIMVVCKNCAHSLFFNALLTGAVTQLDLTSNESQKPPE
ncbi:MAG: hypothetical protein WCK55_14795 [Verrucomicrobiota bacterium]